MIEYQLKQKDPGPATFDMSLSMLRIVFMGTPEFAVASLNALVTAGYSVVGVVTAPDKPAGRGMKITESAVKKYAVKKGLHVLQPEKLKDPVFLEELKSLQADVQIVVAFRMLPEVVWNMPRMGTINLHGSLLPQYRGAAPINWAVINGDKETGVTTFKLKHEIDTGDILLQESFSIGDDETAGEVHDRMMEIGAQLLVKTMKGLVDGSLKETPQEAPDSYRDGSQQPTAIDTQPESTHSPLAIHHSPLRHAPKIFTTTCNIDWTKGNEEIYNLIRGLSPYPAAFTELVDKTLKIYRSEKEWVIPTSKPGQWESDGKTYLKFACKDGYIHVKDIQLEGKKRMLVEDFLRGYHFK
ncbi:MAG: methionyl-tRNA formyltransferase [Chitinophagaceae bacterium]